MKNEDNQEELLNLKKDEVLLEDKILNLFLEVFLRIRKSGFEIITFSNDNNNSALLRSRKLLRDSKPLISSLIKETSKLSNLKNKIRKINKI